MMKNSGMVIIPGHGSIYTDKHSAATLYYSQGWQYLA